MESPILRWGWITLTGVSFFLVCSTPWHSWASCRNCPSTCKVQVYLLLEPLPFYFIVRWFILTMHWLPLLYMDFDFTDFSNWGLLKAMGFHWCGHGLNRLPCWGVFPLTMRECSITNQLCAPLHLHGDYLCIVWVGFMSLCPWSFHFNMAWAYFHWLALLQCLTSSTMASTCMILFLMWLSSNVAWMIFSITVGFLLFVTTWDLFMLATNCSLSWALSMWSFQSCVGFHIHWN